MEEVEKANPYRDGSTGRFTSGGGGAGGSGGGGSKGGKKKKLSRQEDKKVTDLSIELFNLKQSMPLSVRQGKKGPAQRLYAATFSSIVDQAASVLDTTPREAFGELNRRMGVEG